MIPLKKFRSSLFIVVALLLILPFSVIAKGGTLDVSPAYLEVVLEKPQEEKTIELSYTNTSNKPVSLELSSIDFKQQGENGGISFLGKDAARSYSYSLSSFLIFESTTLDLAPGETRTFPVKIQNRQDISPGGHYAAIIARQIQDGEDTTVAPAISSLIFMRKTGGERFNLSVQKIDWPRFSIVFSIPKQANITFQNAGNIHVVPYGRADITDMFGRLVYKGIVNTSSAIIFPETRRSIPVGFTDVALMLPFSFNSLSIKGSDSLHKTSFVYQESFLYINPGIVLVLPLIVVGVVWLKKKKRK